MSCLIYNILCFTYAIIRVLRDEDDIAFVWLDFVVTCAAAFLFADKLPAEMSEHSNWVAILVFLSSKLET